MGDGATRWRKLTLKPKLAIIDGNRRRALACTTRTIVKGDAKCLSIAAASIVAKVTRDRMMIELGAEHAGLRLRAPQGLRRPPEHHDAIRRLGVTAHHRRSFRAVQLAFGLVEA